jgi:hypothetical protein
MQTIDNEQFIEWLNKQPLGRSFDYLDNHGCIFASFAKEYLGWRSACCGAFDVRKGHFGKSMGIPEKYQNISEIRGPITIRAIHERYKIPRKAS